MATKKYVSLEKLSLYDEKIKKYLADADAAALKEAKDYSDSLAENYDAAGSAATALEDAKKYTDELANGQVATNTAAIAKLNGDATTDGSVAKAVADSASTLQASINAVDTIADTNAADIVTMKGQISALEAGTYDDTEVRGLITDNANAIKELETTHGTDKSALETAIAAKADQTALDAVSAVANAAVKQTDYDTKVAALEAKDVELNTAITDEATARANADTALDTRLTKVETFFETADGETLDTALDTLVEIQKYISEDGSAADEMLQDIADNAKAIEDEATARANADSALQDAIDLKADASDLETLDGRVEALETASSTYALKTEVQAVQDALNEYEEAHTSDYTNAQIDAAIKVNTDAIAALGDTYATDAELAAAIADAKTDASNKDAAVLTEAQNAAAAVQTNLDTHTDNADIHVTAANKTTWNAALQAADIASGTANGTISVKGTDVAVTGLGSAAYTASTAYDAAGSAATAKSEAIAYVDAEIAKFVECSETEITELFA